MATILMLLPEQDFDPTESAIPWHVLTEARHKVRFATPIGRSGTADPRLTDQGFGVLSPVLMTRRDDLAKYRLMTADPQFRAALAYDAVRPADFDGLLIPGGHAQGMKTMLESAVAQKIVADFFAMDRTVGAVCHGVLLLARSRTAATGRSVLHGRKTTALTRTLELSAWAMTCVWLGSYYRTYPATVQGEVTAALANRRDFCAGPILPVRDTAQHPERGFVVRDGNYLSARWPGDCHRFAREFVQMIEARVVQAAA